MAGFGVSAGVTRTIVSFGIDNSAGPDTVGTLRVSSYRDALVNVPMRVDLNLVSTTIRSPTWYFSSSYGIELAAGLSSAFAALAGTAGFSLASAVVTMPLPSAAATMNIFDDDMGMQVTPRQPRAPPSGG